MVEFNTDYNKSRKKLKTNNSVNNNHINKYPKINDDNLIKAPIKKLYKSTLWQETHELIVQNQNLLNKVSFLQIVRCAEVINSYKSTNNVTQHDKIECMFNYCRDCFENDETDCCRFLGWRKYI
jgi:Ulp1 family protease